VRREWTKADVKELKAHSKARTRSPKYLKRQSARLARCAEGATSRDWTRASAVNAEHDAAELRKTKTAALQFKLAPRPVDGILVAQPSNVFIGSLGRFDRRPWRGSNDKLWVSMTLALMEFAMKQWASTLSMVLRAGSSSASLLRVTRGRTVISVM